MECSRVREIIFEYADAELAADIREGVQAHLAECPRCAAQARALDDQIQALRSLPKLDAPAGFLHQVQRRLDSPPLLERIGNGLSSLFRSGQFLKVSALAVTAILVVVIYHATREDGSLKGSAPTSPALLQAPAAGSAQPSPPAGIVAKEDRAAALEGQSAQVLSAPVQRATIALVLRLPEIHPSESAPAAAPPAPAQRRQGTVAGPPHMERKATAQREDALDAAGAGPRAAAPAVRARSKAVPADSSREHVRAAMDEVKRLAALHGGKVSEDVSAADMERSGNLEIDIPAEHYPAFLKSIESLGDIRSVPATATPPPGAVVHLAVQFDVEN